MRLVGMFIWLLADLCRSNYCSLGGHIGFQDYPRHTVPTQGHGWEPVLGGLAAEYVRRGGDAGLQGDPSTGGPGLADLQSQEPGLPLASPHLGRKVEPPWLGPAAWRSPFSGVQGSPGVCLVHVLPQGHRAKEMLVESLPGLHLYNSFY